MNLDSDSTARLEGNVRRFTAFRLFYTARFYYPVFTVLFLDYGVTLEQFALLNLVWALSIVVAEVPSGALADILGHKRLLVFAALLMVLEMALLVFVPLGASPYCFSCSCSTESVPVCRKRLPAVLTKRWPTIHSNLWGGRLNGLKFWSGRHGSCLSAFSPQ